MKDFEQMLYTVAGLSAESQKEWFAAISPALSPAELKALQIGVAYFRLLRFPELKAAITETMARELYEMFTGEAIK